MKSRFLSAVRYLILSMSVLNALNMFVFGFFGKLWFGYKYITGTGGYVTPVFLIATSILVVMFSYEFTKPKDILSWLILMILNVFAILFQFLIDLGTDWNVATNWVIYLIISVINTLAFFPYEHFQKPEIKSQ